MNVEKYINFWKAIVKCNVTTVDNNNTHREVGYLKVVHQKHNNELFVDIYLENKTKTHDANQTIHAV